MVLFNVVVLFIVMVMFVAVDDRMSDRYLRSCRIYSQ